MHEVAPTKRRHRLAAKTVMRFASNELTLDKPVPATIRVGHVNVVSDFGPGRHVHPIQARKALEELSRSRPARILSVGGESVELEIDGIASKFECVDAPRLASLVNSGRCVLSDGTRTFGLLGSFGVLVVLASDEGTTISRQPTIDPNIVMTDDGAAIFSPTDGGSWHLFGVAPGSS